MHGVPIIGIDHVAFPTADAERLLEFYVKLGFTAVGVEEWRAGKRPAFALTVGDQKINVHPPELVRRRGEAWYLRAPRAEPGCADLCFVWAGSIDELLTHLRVEGVVVEEGPIARRGGRGGGLDEGQSVYFRDPDENLLELIAYPD